MSYAVDNDIAIFFVTETWLTDNNNSTTASIKSFGYNIIHNFRSNGRGGGVAIIYKKCYNFTKVFYNHSDCFESVSTKFKSTNGDNHQ